MDLHYLQAIPGTRLKIDGAVTLSFYRAAKSGGNDYVFPLFPREGLNVLFPSIEGRAEHYCAFALPEHGSITFYCNLSDILKDRCMENYKKFVAILDTDALRVKAYYPLLHTLRSFGSDFAFKDTDLATCASIRKVFKSFLFMSERIGDWGKDGAIRFQEGNDVRFDASMFRKEISCLRIEASFVLKVPKKKLDSKEVLAPMDSLLGRDLNVLFGQRGNEEDMLTKRLEFMSVNDWLTQVEKVRQMLTSKGEIDFKLRQGWRVITSRAKQQAECLQSLLGYCCRRTNGSVRSRSWGLVWSANAGEEYPGMCVCVI